MNILLNKNFTNIECCSCGTIFFISEELNNRLLAVKTLFYCPKGHSQSYTRSTVDKLRSEISHRDGIIAGLENDLRRAKRKCNKAKKK